MMEAMLAGCVPVVLKLGGPGEIVKSDCGYPIPVEDPAAAVEAITSTLRGLHENRAQCKKLGEAASARIRSHYSESAYLEEIRRIYQIALRSS